MFKKNALTREFTVYSVYDENVKISDEYQETLDPKYVEITGTPTTFTISPLTTRQKVESTSIAKLVTEEFKAGYLSSEYLVRAGLKKVENFEVDGKPLTLQFDSDGLITEECIGHLQDELLIFELAFYIRQVSHIPFFAQLEVGKTKED